MNSLATDRDFIELLKQAAPRLAKTGIRGLTINFQTPPVADPGKGLQTAGLAAKDKSGKPVIWLEPETSEQTFFTNLLHELAHVKLHMHTLARVGDDYINAAPKSQPFPAEAYTSYAWRETDVDRQIQTWLNWAEKHGHERLSRDPGKAEKYINSPYHLILWVLMDYSDPQNKK